MRTREILRRLDAHMERGDVLMGEVREEVRLTREEVRLTREEVRLTREEVELSRQSRDDLRSFIREMVVRMEKAAQTQFAELRDLREESRAQRQALLRLIDRMDRFEPGGSEAAG